jgi:branched-chain amino acid transport system substrate-binding protein
MTSRLSPLRLLMSCLLALASCTLAYDDLAECRADVDCKAQGAALRCDTAHGVCVEVACSLASDCAGLGAGFVCDPKRKLCEAQACKEHEDCAPYGTSLACRAGACVEACVPAAYSATQGAMVRMGAVLPLSIDASGAENGAVRVRRWSIELGLKELNEERGGIQVRSLEARKVGFTFCDSHSDARLAGRLAGVLAAEGAVAVMTAGTSETQQALATTKPRGAVVLSVSATADKLTVSGADDAPVDNAGLFFRAASRDRFQARAILRLLAGEGATKVGVLHDNNDYGKGLAEPVVAGFPAGRAVAVAFDESSGAFSAAALAALAALAPTHVVVAARPANAAKGIAELKNQAGLKDVKLVLSDAAANPAVLDQLAAGASLLDGAVGVVGFVDTEAKEFGDYRTSYELLRRDARGGGGFEAYEREGTYGAQSYDGLYLLVAASAHALARAEANGVVDGLGLAAGLRAVNSRPGKAHRLGPGALVPMLSDLSAGNAVDVQGLTGTLDFDLQGDVAGRYARCVFGGTPVTFAPTPCEPIPN